MANVLSLSINFTITLIYLKILQHSNKTAKFIMSPNSRPRALRGPIRKISLPDK